MAHVLVNYAGAHETKGKENKKNKRLTYAQEGHPVHVRYYCRAVCDLPAQSYGQLPKASSDAGLALHAACPWHGGFRGRGFHLARVQWFEPASPDPSKPHFESWTTDLPVQLTQAVAHYAFIPVARIVSGFVPLLAADHATFAIGPLRRHHQF